MQIFFVAAEEAVFPVQATAQQTPVAGDLDARDQIIVTGRRPPVTQDRRQAEDSLSPADISSFGADRVADVIARLRDYYSRGDFAVIVNGRRLGGIADILELPPEALARIEILPEQSGGTYGLGTDKKVLNLVLRERFRSIIGNATAGTSTDGGGETVSGDARYANLHGERRFNASADVRYASGLLGRDRLSTAIDPTLRNRSLVPEALAATLTAGFARPVGGASLNLTMEAGKRRSSQLGGLAMTGGTDAPGIGVLRQNSRSSNLQAGVSLGGTTGKLSWSLDGRTEFGSSSMATVIRQAPGLAPTAAVSGIADASAFPKRTSTSQRYAIFAMIGGPFVRLPAGSAMFNITVDASTARSAQNAVAAVSNATVQTRNDLGGRLNVSGPLVRRGSGVLGFVGDIFANANVELAHSSGLRSAPSYDMSLNWAVSGSLMLEAGARQSTTFPSVEQLYAPLVRQAGVLLFDPMTNSTLAPTQITGGNPALRRQRETASNIRANYNMRVGSIRAVASVAYIAQRTSDPVLSVSGPGTVLEAAFPERFVRNAQSVLQSIDMRPVNATRRARSNLDWDLHLSGDVRGRRSDIAVQGLRPSARFGGTHWELGLSHSWLISEALLLRPGAPALDLLAAPLNSSGQLPSRHTVQARTGLTNERFTAQLSGNWREGTDGVLGQGAESLRLRYAALLTMDGQMTLNVGRRDSQGEEVAGLRIKLAVTNLLNARPLVAADGGTLPFALDPRILDPVGRTVQLSLRKGF